ncbi:MAG: hypothetical protein QOK16_2070 [Solirubrobacteraceae bacterium]|jgi:hypothetical protein|nr:hypothetical protein [Solirubrobacteraceae bacterium]
MERIEPPKGYVLKNKDEVRDIMKVEAELLRSEGIDPRWPGFPCSTDEQDDSPDQ